ncbi:hypothetical protein HDU67_001193 [Dinochytrium kinnereticum]|nr:hypothetical protein HDU67_001193 [Dinochytrium kinnereticum]
MGTQHVEYIDSVIALHSYEAKDATCLSFQKGDIIDVIAKDASGWILKLAPWVDMKYRHESSVSVTTFR